MNRTNEYLNSIPQNIFAVSPFTSQLIILVHCPSTSQQIRSPLPKHIPAHNKQRHHLPHARQEDHTPQIRHPLTRIININKIIHYSTNQIPYTQRIQLRSR